MAEQISPEFALVQALENTANKLQGAVNSVTGIFH